MSSSRCCVALLVLSALCSVSRATYQGSGWWLQQPYTEDDEFTARVEYGANHTLNCSEVFDVEYWVIPDMTIIDEIDSSKMYFSIDGYSYTQWAGDGKLLHLTLLVEDQFGFYFCHGKDSDDKRQVVKKAVNYKGPYFGDLWEAYRMNTIVGCSAAGAFLVIAIVSYCVYEWKFSDDEEDYVDDSLPNNNGGSVYHTNHAYDGDAKVMPGGASVMPEDSTML